MLLQDDGSYRNRSSVDPVGAMLSELPPFASREFWPVRQDDLAIFWDILCCRWEVVGQDMLSSVWTPGLTLQSCYVHVWPIFDMVGK
jgi:hypothetical protein